jgi:hypothetical protein
MLVRFLILFFLVLIIYQIILAHMKCIEGLGNYQDYDTNNPNNALILSQQNAGNIAYLKERIDTLTNLDGTVHDLSLNVAQLNSQMEELVKQQAVAASNLVGTKPLQISGT